MAKKPAPWMKPEKAAPGGKKPMPKGGKKGC